MTDEPTPTGIDHPVLTVADVGATCDFHETLGGEAATFGDGRSAVRFGDRTINLHPVDRAVADHVAAAPTSGATTSVSSSRRPSRT
jgi:hypothetical protein